MTAQYEGKEPCCRCIHKKVCEATKCLNEIKYTVTHPFFNIKVECTEFYNEHLVTMVEREFIKGVRENDERRNYSR